MTKPLDPIGKSRDTNIENAGDKIGVLLPRRDRVFSMRHQNERLEVNWLLSNLLRDLEKVIPLNSSPEEYIEVTWDRFGGGIDRYTDYVLGVILEELRKAGWLEVTHSLVEGNKKIKLCIK